MVAAGCRPHEPSTDVLGIAALFKIRPGRGCIKYCGVARRLAVEALR
jgi:hypothetical protein